MGRPSLIHFRYDSIPSLKIHICSRQYHLDILIVLSGRNPKAPPNAKNSATSNLDSMVEKTCMYFDVLEAYVKLKLSIKLCVVMIRLCMPTAHWSWPVWPNLKNIHKHIWPKHIFSYFGSLCIVQALNLSFLWPWYVWTLVMTSLKKLDSMANKTKYFDILEAYICVLLCACAASGHDDHLKLM